jgi:hypothetical protein
MDILFLFRAEIFAYDVKPVLPPQTPYTDLRPINVVFLLFLRTFIYVNGCVL